MAGHNTLSLFPLHTYLDLPLPLSFSLGFQLPLGPLELGPKLFQHLHQWLLLFLFSWGPHKDR